MLHTHDKYVSAPHGLRRWRSAKSAYVLSGLFCIYGCGADATRTREAAPKARREHVRSELSHERREKLLAYSEEQLAHLFDWVDDKKLPHEELLEKWQEVDDLMNYTQSETRYPEIKRVLDICARVVCGEFLVHGGLPDACADVQNFELLPDEEETVLHWRQAFDARMLARLEHTMLMTHEACVDFKTDKAGARNCAFIADGVCNLIASFRLTGPRADAIGREIEIVRSATSEILSSEDGENYDGDR